MAALNPASTWTVSVRHLLGINNTVTGNTINEACAGILLGTAHPIPPPPNTFMNVTNTTLAGDVCPLPVADYASGAMIERLSGQTFFLPPIAI